MPQMIFVNLPVTDLARSVAFYEAVGASRRLHFCDETATCMVFSEAIRLTSIVVRLAWDLHAPGVR